MLRFHCLGPRLYSLRGFVLTSALLCITFLLKVGRYTMILDFLRPQPHVIAFRNLSISYRYLLLPNLTKCNEPTVVAVAVILTTRENYEAREVIRKTWASPNQLHSVKNGYVVVYFIIGAPKHEYDLSVLVAEQSRYGDLIVTDVFESYENLVLKVYTAMMFFKHYCSKANFLIKVDDDAMIHLDRMFNRWNQTGNDEGSMFGLVWPEHAPIRDRTNKWYISYDQWPEKYYPDYCDGPAYIVGRVAVDKILEHAKNISLFPFEDVLYTGILASVAGVPRVNWTNGVLVIDQVYWQGMIACEDATKPLTFMMSSFQTRLSYMEAFRKLKIYTCKYIHLGPMDMGGF